MKRFFSVAGISFLAALACASVSKATELGTRATIMPASPEETRHKEDVFTFLQDYFSALAKGEVAKLTAYHPSLTAEQLDLLRDYFTHTVRDLHIRLERVHVQVAANTATVTFYRTDQFIDRPTGRSVKKGIELSTLLVQGPNGWRLPGFDQIAFALVNSKTRNS